jgi:NAB conserved region 1 (NCD1)
VVVTSTPSNEAELQLYRVLQRASLLAYYDTLLEMGELTMRKYILSLFLNTYLQVATTSNNSATQPKTNS